MPSSLIHDEKKSSSFPIQCPGYTSGQEHCFSKGIFQHILISDPSVVGCRCSNGVFRKCLFLNITVFTAPANKPVGIYHQQIYCNLTFKVQVSRSSLSKRPFLIPMLRYADVKICQVHSLQGLENRQHSQDRS